MVELVLFWGIVGEWYEKDAAMEWKRHYLLFH